MVFLTILFLGSLTATTGLGFWLFQRLARWPLLDRLIATLAPSIALIILEVTLIKVLGAPYGGDLGNLNSTRLAPVMGWVHGYPLYYYPGSGPVTGNLYGPMTAIVYLPATLFRTPSSALVTASLISVLLCFAPMLWLHLGQRSSRQQQGSALLAFLVFCGFAFTTPALNYSVIAVHADAPALGFAGFACAWLYYRKSQTDWRSLLLSALFASLSVWSKQTLLPILVALPLYLLLVEGYRSSLRYLLYLGGIMLGLAALFLALFEPHRLVYSLLFMPTTHEWVGGRSLATLLRGVKELWLISTRFLSLLGLSLGLQLALWRGRTPDPTRPKLAENRWFMLIILSILLIPMSILGRIKEGGDVNALSMSLYFLAAATSLALVELVQDWSVSYQPLIQNASKALLLVLALTFAVTQAPAPEDLHWVLNNLTTNPHEVAFRYAKQHPEEVYFPHDVVVSLMTDGKLYHQEDGLYALYASRIPLTKDEFWAHMPAKLKFVADPANEPPFALEYMTTFKRTTAPPELADWVVMAPSQTP